MDSDVSGGVTDGRRESAVVHRLEFDVPWPPKHVAAYLIDGPEPILIDAGGHESTTETTMADALESVGFAPADVEHVLVTHVHSDHIGQVDALREAGATIYAPGPAIERLETDLETMREGAREMARVAGYPDGRIEEIVDAESDSIRRDRRLLDPDETRAIDPDSPITVGGRRFRPIETPGHEMHHLCFETAVDDERLLFAGDALAKTFRVGAFHAGINRGAFEAVDATFEALDRLADIDAVRGYPGHGPVFDEPQAVVDRTRQWLEDLLEETADALEAVEPATPLSVAEERVGEVEYYAPVLDSLGALGTLERRGIVAYDVEDGVRYYRTC
ncbi:MBL fold metallo-hydrolase [Halopiger goleimassiliensis]|uniref:MBL fold metallo-hydrolase n=1 Tax=Halopiger goleimassiliensis TaxID=1293048 RepID=UPI0006775F3E|nr:MBL fold metallo-hydrolase [Halopiger goleimassiliensis]